MTFAEIVIAEPPGGREIDRRGHILAAAERAFVRHGFHAATMQDVAAEARMSPGNLYRYFPSKDAIVAGLCARDQAAMAADFSALAISGDFLAGIKLMLHKHLIGEPRQRCQLIVEIWAEATRNPAVAAMCAGIDSEVRRGLAALIDGAKARGAAAPGIDTDFAVRAVLTVGIGLFKRRAHEPQFDGDAEVALALGIITAVFGGTVRPMASGRGAAS